MIVPDFLLQEITQMTARVLGWDFPPNRVNDLERGLLATAKELGVPDTPDAIINWLSNISWNAKELDILSTHLTIGETYFFREKPGLDVFQKQVIPEIIKERRGKDQYLRIWCAGCCTGEEPYTLAIILKEMIPDINNWKITILATDINRNFLKKAQSGVYGQWSFRETSQDIKSKYFTMAAGRNWEINQEIKKMITFSLLNLADDLYPSALTNTQNHDVVFCRNVLMYFTPEQIKLVAKRFNQSLVENGCLITSVVELNDHYFSDFATCSFGEGIYYRKSGRRTEVGNSDPLTKLVSKSRSAKTASPRSKTKPVATLPARLATIPIDAALSKKPLLGTLELKKLFEKGQYHQCVGHCQLLLSNTPSDVEVLNILVKSYANMGNLAEAKRWGEILLSMDGAKADSYYLLATVLMEENMPAKAESLLKRGLYLNPHHLLSHFLMGSIATRENKSKIAAKHFQNVIELLSSFHENDIVPGSEGLTAGRIKEIVASLHSL